MRKKIISLILTFSALFAFVPAISAQAAASISIGEYVQMGTYYGKPILWRCVDIDDNGPLMLSDKIICIKPFDARTSENNTTGSHSRRANGTYKFESNYWGDSNMRSWLNSDASAGKVTWLCGNPPSESYVFSGHNAYDQEAGFLTNFSSDELKSIKEVTQKSLLSYYDRTLDTTGATTFHTYNYKISEVLQNYDSCYAEYLTDKMFLLDVKQVNTVYNNSEILGDEYYIGKPTEECVENAETASTALTAGEKWYYWLRTPYAKKDKNVYIRNVNEVGNIGSQVAYGNVSGVRPAFYLDTESVSFADSGTESDPYTVSTTKTVGFTFEEEASSFTDENAAVWASYTYNNETKDTNLGALYGDDFDFTTISGKGTIRLAVIIEDVPADVTVNSVTIK